ncbi:hypothetical protein FB45DRAFT_1116939, partial [Roridomyces roridus]
DLPTSESVPNVRAEALRPLPSRCESQQSTISHLLQGLHCGMDTSACGYIGDGRQAAVEPEVNEASDDEDDEDSAPSGLPRLTKWPKYTLQALFKGREPPARPTREEIAAEDEREARNAAADALEDGIPDDSAIEMTSTAGLDRALHRGPYNRAVGPNRPYRSAGVEIGPYGPSLRACTPSLTAVSTLAKPPCTPLSTLVARPVRSPTSTGIYTPCVYVGSERKSYHRTDSGRRSSALSEFGPIAEYVGSESMWESERESAKTEIKRE